MFALAAALSCAVAAPHTSHLQPRLVLQHSRLGRPAMWLEADRSPYAVLGVQPGVSAAALKAAFRGAARIYHPDRNLQDPDATRKFLEIKQVRVTHLAPSAVR